jgi:hypothetical protein
MAFAPSIADRTSGSAATLAYARWLTAGFVACPCGKARQVMHMTFITGAE